VAAGDPCQLPPLVASPQAVSGSREGAVNVVASANRGLGRSLFERLVAAGLPTHLLRRQYRCHPDIAAVPNRCFYGAESHGTSAARVVNVLFKPGSGDCGDSLQHPANLCCAVLHRRAAAGWRLGSRKGVAAARLPAPRGAGCQVREHCQHGFASAVSNIAMAASADQPHGRSRRHRAVIIMGFIAAAIITASHDEAQAASAR
jgi:AAA domain